MEWTYNTEILRLWTYNYSHNLINPSMSYLGTVYMAHSRFASSRWTNVDLSSVRSSGIDLRLQEIPQPSVTEISLKMSYQNFCSNLPGSNELTHRSSSKRYGTTDRCNHWHELGYRCHHGALFCPACRTTLVATRFRVAVICPIIQVPHCIRVFFYFVWFVFINHIFQFYYELCTYCNILDIYLS